MSVRPGGEPNLLMWCFMGIELASVGVDRLIHVDYFRGLVEFKYNGFAAIQHLSKASLT